MPRARVIRTPRASRSDRARTTEPLLLSLPGDGRSPFHLAPSLLSMRPGCLVGELVSVCARESPRPPLQALDHRPPAGIPAGPAAGDGLSGLWRPAPVTGARTRRHGVRSPAHKTFRRRRRVQSGDQPTWKQLPLSGQPGSPGNPRSGGTRLRTHGVLAEVVFPFRPLCQDSGDLAGWRPVGKRRRISRFSLADGPAAGHAPGLGHKPRCEVELTEVRTNGQDWWTLGFEATGPAGLLRRAL